MKTTSCTGQNAGYAFDNAPRCGARCKRNNGEPCRSPAIRDKKRCRIHGGRNSGAPQGNTNALKHGHTTNDAKQFRKTVKRVILEANQLITVF